MNRTPDQWGLVNPDAVVAGSTAQARNVLEMALQEIAELTELVVQYRDDLKHPPAPDSIKRRLEQIKKVAGV
jgi:phenylalanyl-tRNA synthetase beta subunit